MRHSQLSALCALTFAAAACRTETPPPAPAPAPPAETAQAPEPPPPAKVYDIRSARIEKRKTFSGTLTDLGVSNAEVNELIAALKGVFDFRKLRLGDQVRVTLSEGRLEAFEYRASPVDEWLVRREGERLVGTKREVEVVKKLATVDITVGTSLYEAMLDAGEDPALAVDIADVFAWDIDFYRDVRSGDRLRAVVEKYFAHGRLLRYGNVLGVRYEGGQVGSRRLMRYATAAGDTSYFDEKGNSAKKSFLKSPMKFVHITSRYGGRRHPLLGYVHNHNGVDFAAAVGTPIWSVADGTVTRVVRGDPAAGHYVFVRHMNGFETGYLHLSRFAAGISPGVRVKQKQVIAYSGNTGRSTGPHLHFAMKRGGQYVNPLAQKFPRPEPLPRAELERFAEQTMDTATLLNAEFIAQM